jgi:hypothetical protein
MRSILAIISALVMIYLPFSSMAACDSPAHSEKKPAGLRTASSDEPNYDLTPQDRIMWKSVLHWCDECDERASFVTQQGGRGGILIYPINKTQYIVAVECEMAMQQGELIFYKVTEHSDTIESRLLPLEQYDFIQTKEDVERLHAKQTGDPHAELQDVGKFIRFTDTLIYGGVIFTGKNRNLLVVEHRYRGVGGCGLLTIYDVSGDCPKVVEFRAKTYCSANYVPPEKWKLYPAKVRAKWRTGPNRQREDWKDKNQCR